MQADGTLDVESLNGNQVECNLLTKRLQTPDVKVMIVESCASHTRNAICAGVETHENV